MEAELRIVVLGAGRVGSAIVADLAAEDAFHITAADSSPEALERAQALGARRTEQIDLTDVERLRQLAAAHELVVGAVPGPLGHRTLETVIRAGTNVVDISFFEGDAFELDLLAKDRGVVAVVDCGVAPGLSNALLGFMEAASDRVERFLCCVGGLPVDRSGLFQYRAPFSPIDVIAQYTRSARYVEDGQIHVGPPLSQVEQIEFPGVGTLEAFLSDGLRTLLRTTSVPDMREKTLRYPGHVDQMRLLRDMGLFDDDPIEVDGMLVTPRRVAAALLFPRWRFRPGEADMTVMRVEIDALSGRTVSRHVFDLLDHYDEQTGTLSMARTTGYTCTAVVRLIARGQFSASGVSAPEAIGRDPACFETLVTELRDRGVELRESVSPIHVARDER